MSEQPEPDPKSAKVPEVKDPEFPKITFLIILNEFCERFSYYGMKAVLALFVKNILNHTEDTTTVLYHVFCTFCYFTPLFGGMLADSFLGKYKTIVYLSILYAFGNAILAISAIPYAYLNQEGLAILGLFFIACGTGGVKPCVSAFGGDQFILPEQQKQLAAFFSIFYFFINLGSLLSISISPLLKKNVKCFEMDTCYPLSFGLPAVLMVISIVLLVMGRSKYIYKEPEGSIFSKAATCTFYALKEKIKRRKEPETKRSHWLEYADGQYSSDFIDDLTQLYRVIILFIPIPFFWALFDQQGSRWTFQATTMSGEMGGVTMKPDQMVLLNPLMMLPLIVLFYKVIYPVAGKFGWLKSHLQRMTVGGILIGIAFVLAGVLQKELDKTYPEILNENESRLNLVNNIPCLLNVDGINTDLHLDLEMYGKSSSNKIEADKVYDLWFVPSDRTATCGNLGHTIYKWKSKPGKTDTLFAIYEDHYGIIILQSKFTETIAKSGEGVPVIRFAFLGLEKEKKNRAVLKIKDDQNKVMRVWIANDEDRAKFKVSELDEIPVLELDTPSYRTEPYKHFIELHMSSEETGSSDISKVGQVHPRQGGNYLYVIVRSPTSQKHYEIREYVITAPNSIHMLWLTPQYFLLTVAEVMFSISGAEFAFNEAPASMKSLFQALWLLNVAFGNIIVIFLTEFQIYEEQYKEFFMFAVMMFIAMLNFAILSSKYKWKAGVKQVEETGQGPEIDANLSRDQDMEMRECVSFFSNSNNMLVSTSSSIATSTLIGSRENINDIGGKQLAEEATGSPDENDEDETEI